MRGVILGACLVAVAATAAGAQQADPAPYAPLIERYVAACQRLSAAECEFAEPPTPEDTARLACLFSELERRGGEGTAAAHVAWAEAYAAAGAPPATGFPSSIGDQQTLMAAMIACRGAAGTQ